ncbi:unnamed protein product [Prorocentrum cordatum]|uniref:Uncharacterized protein n=1 Tax=Prorocentrum cordatum TaxID=2364126 RepID=A0ABN9UIH8_9DINO|nr:unnamed protein product [Polarella glacialis]
MCPRSLREAAGASLFFGGDWGGGLLRLTAFCLIVPGTLSVIRRLARFGRAPLRVVPRCLGDVLTSAEPSRLVAAAGCLVPWEHSPATRPFSTDACALCVESQLSDEDGGQERRAGSMAGHPSLARQRSEAPLLERQSGSGS